MNNEHLNGTGFSGEDTVATETPRRGRKPGSKNATKPLNGYFVTVEVFGETIDLERFGKNDGDVEKQVLSEAIRITSIVRSGNLQVPTEETEEQ